MLKMAGQTEASIGKLSGRVYYALPVITVYFLIGPLTTLQGIYAKYYGLSLTAISLVLLISRLFDSISDPLIGYISDRYYARTGSRKPFILVGGLLLACSGCFLYLPPEGVTSLYFLVSFLAFYLGYTLFEIPHLTLVGDLAGSSDAKNSLYSWRVAFMFLGGLIFYIVPLLPIFETTEITPETLYWSVIFGGGLMIPLLFISVIKTPNATKTLKSHKLGKPPRLRLFMITSNIPFLLFLLSFFLIGIGSGSWFTLLFIFIDSYLAIGDSFAFISLVSMIFALISLGIWQELATIFVKQKSWIFSSLLLIFGIFGLGLLNPGTANLLLVLLFVSLSYIGLAGVNLIAPSLLSDIVDYSKWKYCADYSAIYFSVYTQIVKANLAFGGAMGLAISGAAGFKPGSKDFLDSAVIGLKISFSWLPLLLVIMSVFIILKVPIDKRQHNIIKRRLSLREVR